MWWALGEVSIHCQLDELHLAGEAPGLLQRLAAAAKAVAGGFAFQGLSQVGGAVLSGSACQARLRSQSAGLVLMQEDVLVCLPAVPAVSAVPACRCCMPAPR